MEKIIGYKDTNILTEKGIIKTNLIIQDGIITHIGNNEIDGMITLEDNKILVPGFIDEHIHGLYGTDAMDEDISSIITIASKVLKEGVTSFLVTTSTSSINKTINTLKNVKNFINSNYDIYAEVLGVHLEGPFISKVYQGAQLGEYIIKPNIKVMNDLITASCNNIKLITLAPEEDLGFDLIKFLKEKDITVSIGHSDATYDVVKEAINYGLTTVTHTYNALRPIHHREVGALGAAMLFDELYTELICDGIHVSKPAVKLLCKNKPLDKIILITDSLSAKGLKDGAYVDNNQIIYMKNNELRLEDGTLAGSSLKMNQAIKNIMDYTNISFENAIKFATENPAKNLNVFDRVGSITEGKFANFAVVDLDLNVYQTIRCGNVVYTKEED